VFIVEQSAIIGAIQSKKNSRQKIVIITDSLSTIMAAESRTPTKNPKKQTIRKLLDQKGPSYGSPVTREYQVTKRPPRQQKKRWTRTSQPLKGYKRNAKERARGNIQT
jgi:hypothetical protein